ncbi:Homocysteine S-methyltransferase [Penicillium expansum]|uniref:Homocysteine S-methyltransferase n=1 Tax=Penicillium expansum TaxID=27334 RepID=A0A0A2IUT5_PENEN|nr:Homocysteine S-methyltransferase [Penicillium expansum]KGO46251.1 Homocysteine S-methyltransferase [Penicillium expansum]KGO58208.1 Homocysteine S-methyltransferase [Penicillium expansum]KGO66379.1 Homocysteine S-methyltransferase [Penicillium expansum]
MGSLSYILPQLVSSELFVTEGGIETTLIYRKNIDMPGFSTLPLLGTEEGRKTILSIYQDYVNIALAHSTGIVLETRTWRGSPVWSSTIGLSVAQIVDLNRTAVKILRDLRHMTETPSTPIVISGAMGPLQDAYKDSTDMYSFSQAREYYGVQIRAFAEEGVDMLCIMTVTNLDEATAAVRVAREYNLPIHVSFSIETDGQLRGGRTLEDAIREVDRLTENYTTYFGVNCAHPRHIMIALQGMSDDVRSRIGSIRGNSSLKCHDELDNSVVLDRGDISVWVQEFNGLLNILPGLKVVGGCCGTDEEHVDAIARRIHSFN